MKKIGILDYEVGNLKSIINAMDYCGFNYVISSNSKDFSSCDRMIIPGVGAFGMGMSNMKRLGLPHFLQASFKSQIPMLGICLGYQLFCASSSEFGHCDGLEIIPTVVRKLNAPIVPHVGWSKLNDVSSEMKNTIYKGIDHLSFYFVHTFAVAETEPLKKVATTTQYYEDQFLSSVKLGNFFGVQFHPEKSSEQGLTLLKNFYDY